MSFDFDLTIKVAGPVLGGLITKLFGDWLERRPRLVCFHLHNSAVRLREKPGTAEVTMHFHSIVVANQGKEPANNVRLGHNVRPDFDIFPAIEYEINQLPGGSEEILIPLLAPKEQLTISYAYFPPLLFTQTNTYVRCDEGAARILMVLPTIQPPRWILYAVWIFAAVGAISITYGMLALFPK